MSSEDDKQFRIVSKWAGGREHEMPLSFDEPVEAVEAAESVLSNHPVKSHAKIYFNGETEPQHLLVLQGKTPSGTPIYGLFNSPTARWPVYYPPTGGGEMLSLDDLPEELQEIAAKSPDAVKGEDATKLKIDHKEDEGDEEDVDETAEDGEDGRDDGGDDEWDSEDEGDEEGDEEEQDFTGEDGEEAREDSDDSAEEEQDSEDEVEMPRLNIFAKLFTPSGARKRAEIDMEKARNKYRVRFGIVDEEAEKTKEQEREWFAAVEFTERDDNRTHGTLTLTVPEESWETMEIDGTTITLQVPYRSEKGE